MKRGHWLGGKTPQSSAHSAGAGGVQHGVVAKLGRSDAKGRRARRHRAGIWWGCVHRERVKSAEWYQR